MRRKKVYYLIDPTITGSIVSCDEDTQLISIKTHHSPIEIKTMPIVHFNRYWAYFDGTEKYSRRKPKKVITTTDIADYVYDTAKKYDMLIEYSDHNTNLLYVKRKDGTYGKPSAFMVKTFTRCVNVYTKSSYLNKKLIYNSRMSKLKSYYYDKVGKIINLNEPTKQFIDDLFKQVSESYEDTVATTERKKYTPKARHAHKKS